MRAAVADAWSASAEAYAATWAPRFAPWVSTAVAALRGEAARARPSPPPGPLLDLGCGPGHELAALASAFPGRRLVARDAAPGMVRLASARAGPGVTVEVDDARAVGYQPSILFSAFLLQAMPARAAALTAWVAALPPGGLAGVLWWPSPAAQPDVAWAAVTAGPPDGGSDEGNTPAGVAAAAAAGGGAVLLDENPVHMLCFASRAALADALLKGGPLTVAAAVDPAAAAELATAAAALAETDPEGTGGGGVFLRPSARLVVVRKGLGRGVGGGDPAPAPRL